MDAKISFAGIDSALIYLTSNEVELLIQGKVQRT